MVSNTEVWWSYCSLYLCAHHCCVLNVFFQFCEFQLSLWSVILIVLRQDCNRLWVISHCCWIFPEVNAWVALVHVFACWCCVVCFGFLHLVLMTILPEALQSFGLYSICRLMFLVMLLYMNKCMPAVSTLVCISQYTKYNIYYYYYEYLIYGTQINRKIK